MKKSFKLSIKPVLIALSHPNLLFKRFGYTASMFLDDFLYRFGKNNYPNNIFFIAGLPLSGTTWVKNLIGRIPGVFSRPMPMPYDIRYKQNICDSAFKFVPQNGNTLIKTHLNCTKENLECIQRNGVQKVVITIRDFRDVVLSHYHRLIVDPKPKDAVDYFDYLAVSKEEGINQCIDDCLKYMVPWVDSWIEESKKDTDKYYVVRFEDLKKDVKSEFNRILAFYGISLVEDLRDKIIEQARGKKNMEENLKESYVLPFGISSNFRKGEVGGWRKEFTEGNILYAKKVIGDALISHGYEHNLNW